MTHTLVPDTIEPYHGYKALSIDVGELDDWYLVSPNAATRKLRS